MEPLFSELLCFFFILFSFYYVHRQAPHIELIIKKNIITATKKTEKKKLTKKRSDDTSIVQYLCFVTHIIRFFYDCFFFVQNFNDRNEQNKTGIKAPL